MRKRKGNFFPDIFIIVLIPYLITMFVNGTDMVTFNRRMNPETILPSILESQISGDYRLETLEAQAVIARSNFYRKLQNSDNFLTAYEDMAKNIMGRMKLWEVPDEKFHKAVRNTSGQILTFQGELKQIPYHEISSGQTRDGETAFHNADYAYLKSVDSSQDKDSAEYLNSTYISAQQLPEELKVQECDENGYVVSLQADENILEAESFVVGMGIRSADFTIQKMEDKVRFVSRGKGHGIGFSQYGGNELAKEGKSWQEILNTYFPLMEISTTDFWEN